MNISEIRNKILSSNGKIFSVGFTKANGEDRTLIGRVNTSKGVKGTRPTYVLTEDDPCVRVLDMQNSTSESPQWRAIRLDRVHCIKVNGVEYEV